VRARTRVIALVLAIAGLALPGRAQQPDESAVPDTVGGLPFAGEVDVTVVNVSVYVTDKEGDTVTDLRADDFVLSQDGVVRPITNFGLFTEDIYRSFYQSGTVSVGVPTPTPVPGSETLSREALRPVYVVLYFDNKNSRPIDRNRLITQVRPFIRENLHPPVQMMVIAYQQSQDVLQTFTSDEREIYDALREVKNMTGGRTELDGSRKDILREFAEYERTRGRGDSSSISRAHGMMIGFAEEESNNLQFTLGALRDTVTMLSGLPGKKVIVYISNGLPMTPGLDLFYSFATSYNQPSTITESARFNMTRQYTTLVANANAQDVTFCTIGIGGLENPSMVAAEIGTPQDTMSASIGQQNYLDSLFYIADNTDGISVINTNDFAGGLKKIAQDFYTYYSLGYTLNQSGLDKIHKIEVEVPEHPDYRLRYRQRFVEKSLESQVQDKVVTGLMFPLEDNPMEIMMEIGTQAPAGGERWMVPFELSFPLRRVALLPSGDDYVANVTLFLAARSTTGDRSDVIRQSHEVRVKAADYEDAQRERFTIGANLLMETGTYNVAVGLLDPVTRQTSFATTKVTVHD
jgi:VWFA-related protein